MPDYKTPGVFFPGNSPFPPSIVPVPTAIPVFIGYTQKATRRRNGDLFRVPTKIGSLADYVQLFGGPAPDEGITLQVNTRNRSAEVTHQITAPTNYSMAYALQAYFLNGGGPCYIVSVGGYAGGGGIDGKALLAGLQTAGKMDEITLIVFPDGPRMSPVRDYYQVIKQALIQCKTLRDRFTICDVCMPHDDALMNAQSLWNDLSGPSSELQFGAAYYPDLAVQLDRQFEAEEVRVNRNGRFFSLASLEQADQRLYLQLEKYLRNIPVILPPAAIMAGIYAQVDRDRGVWKTPANVEVNRGKPVLNITDGLQVQLNAGAPDGKYINPIRSFPGRGAIAWGARTLAGNDNEWRYISVRRYFNMVEESVKKGTQPFVFEPNDANTWRTIRAMIENFLTNQWRAGALAGAKPEEAFFVRVGLNETMTAQDIQAGRMIVEIGMAMVRPAEFIILGFTLNMG